MNPHTSDKVRFLSLIFGLCLFWSFMFLPMKIETGEKERGGSNGFHESYEIQHKVSCDDWDWSVLKVRAKLLKHTLQHLL